MRSIKHKPRVCSPVKGKGIVLGGDIPSALCSSVASLLKYTAFPVPTANYLKSLTLHCGKP